MLRDSGYILSKYVCEALVKQVFETGLLSGCIVWSGLVTGSSETGVANPEDLFAARLLVGIHELQAYFLEESILDLTQVDVVAEVLVVLITSKDFWSLSFE